jgi:hypothetical protein
MMFDLKPIERSVDCAREEFEYQRQRENGASGEQIEIYLFFAGCSLKWPSTEIISIAFLNLEALGGITRLKAQSGVAGAEIRRRHQPWVARTDTQNRPASPIDSAAFLEGKVWNSLFECSL